MIIPKPGLLFYLTGFGLVAGALVWLGKNSRYTED